MRAVCLLAMALLAGCGQKGPLYFAPQPPAQTPPERTQNPPPASPAQADAGSQTPKTNGN